MKRCGLPASVIRLDPHLLTAREAVGLTRRIARVLGIRVERQRRVDMGVAEERPLERLEVRTRCALFRHRVGTRGSRRRGLRCLLRSRTRARRKQEQGWRAGPGCGVNMGIRSFRQAEPARVQAAIVVQSSSGPSLRDVGAHELAHAIHRRGRLRTHSPPGREARGRDPAQRSSETWTPACPARAASRVESSQTVSIEPTPRYSGGSPVRSARIGEMPGSSRSASPA